MANWQRQLDLSDVWDKCPDEIGIGELGEIVAKRLRSLKPFKVQSLDEDREEIAADFEDLKNYVDPDFSDFNEVMTRLYDWADTPLDNKWNGHKACWIER